MNDDRKAPAPVAQRDDGMPTSADERALRRLLAARVAMPHTYMDDGEAHGHQHGIGIDFMREPVGDIDAKLRALNVARIECAAPAPVAQDAGLMPLIEDYAKAIHDGDDAACVVLRRTIEASLEQPAPAPVAHPADDPDSWEANAQYLLDKCPFTVRQREGGGSEDLKASLVVTFQGMQMRLQGHPMFAKPAPAPVMQGEPVAWLYTLEYGETVADKKVSLSQLNYPFGVCSADYLRSNDDGVSYVRQTPMYAAPAPVLTQAQIDRIVREVAELPDRESPEDHPEMMLVTAIELRSIIEATGQEGGAA